MGSEGRIALEVFSARSVGGRGVSYPLLVVLGLVGLDVVAHGLRKLVLLILEGVESLGGGIIAFLGLPFPAFFGVIVMLIELIGGVLLLIAVVREATPGRGR
jgi:uncharacterized membrane protein YphA (DoxX/SURF4 family)